MGNSMVSSGIWEKKHARSEFSKDDQNCTSPKDELLRPNKNNSWFQVSQPCFIWVGR
jgi:hypothetical protein